MNAPIVNRRKRRIGVDCDGVLYVLEEAFNRALPPKLRLEVTPEATKWHFYEDFELNRDDFQAFARQGIRNGVIFWTGEPYEGVKEGMKLLKDAGHEIVIITHRGILGEGEELARRATEYWLSHHGIPYDELHLTGDKGSIPTDYMIDDKPENIELIKVSGSVPVMQERPWNSHYQTEYTATSFLDFAQKILALMDEEDALEAQENVA